jgi:hypothetical protein
MKYDSPTFLRSDPSDVIVERSAISFAAPAEKPPNSPRHFFSDLWLKRAFTATSCLSATATTSVLNCNGYRKLAPFSPAQHNGNTGLITYVLRQQNYPSPHRAWSGPLHGWRPKGGNTRSMKIIGKLTTRRSELRDHACWTSRRSSGRSRWPGPLRWLRYCERAKGASRVNNERQQDRFLQCGWRNCC